MVWTCQKYRCSFLLLSSLIIFLFLVKDFPLADLINSLALQDEFSAVITKALVTLVNGLETKFDTEMAAMTRISWNTLESVGDQSG